VLEAFIANPAAVVPHTSMSFAGISRPQTRANIMAYMKQATQP
jgi:cytochrome c2